MLANESCGRTCGRSCLGEGRQRAELCLSTAAGLMLLLLIIDAHQTATSRPADGRQPHRAGGGDDAPSGRPAVRGTYRVQCTMYGVQTQGGEDEGLLQRPDTRRPIVPFHLTGRVI